MSDNVRTGKPDIDPDAPTHISGVSEGNSCGNYEKQQGHMSDGKSSAERSTGINAKGRDVVDPTMPNLSPP